MSNATVRHRRRRRAERATAPPPSHAEREAAEVVAAYLAERAELLARIADAKGASSRKRWRERLEAFDAAGGLQ